MLIPIHLPRLIPKLLTAIIICVLGFGYLSAVEAEGALTVQINQFDTTEFPRAKATVVALNEFRVPIQGLGLQNFAAFDGDRRIEVSSVSRALDAGVGVAIVLAIDTSGSMAGEPLEQAKQVANSYIGQLSANEQVAVVSFSSSVAFNHGFSSDKSSLTNAINGLQASGSTALHDAVARSLEVAESAPQIRRAVILLTDGRDSGGVSSFSRDETITRAVGTGVPIFTVTLGSDVDSGYLEELSNRSYGKLASAATPDQLGRLYSTIQALLREQYVLSLNFGANATPGHHIVRIVVSSGSLSGSNERSFEVGSPPAIQISLNGELASGQTIDAPLLLTPTISSDRGVAYVRYVVDGREVKRSSEAPYAYTIDPVEYPPGARLLRLQAVDSTGRTADLTVALTIATLPPRISVVGPGGPVIAGQSLSLPEKEPLRLEVDIAAQGATVPVSLYHKGKLLIDKEAPPYVFELEESAVSGAGRLEFVAGTEATGISKFTLEVGQPGVGLPLFPLGGWLAVVVLVLALTGSAVAIGMWRRSRRDKAKASAEVMPEESTGPMVNSLRPSLNGTRLERTPPRPLARLALLDKNGTSEPIKFVDLGREPVTIGSAPGCDLTLTGDAVAPRHARIWYRDGRFMLHNLSPVALTAVDGHEVKWVVLEDGDEIEIGAFRLIFDISSS